MFIPDVYRNQISLVEMYNGLRKVISSVISNRDSWPFREPIDEKIAPMYYQIIPNPIDLSVIKRKIDDRLYNDLSEIEEDFKLLVNNCETYNGPKNGYTLMSYGIWRIFKRSVKRFLDADLNYDEQATFIYPPKRSNLNMKAAIEARRKRRKHRKLRALDILAKAAEEAVKCTTIRGTRSDGSDIDPSSSSQSPLQFKSSNSSDKVKFVSNISGTQICFSVESLSDCESNSNFPSHLTLNLNIGLDEENLTFKSLSEWSDYIRLHGEPVKLPQQSVILPQTPLERTSGHLHPNEIRLFRAICLEKLKLREREQSTSSISSDDRSGWSDSSDSSSSSSTSSNYSPPENTEHKPIVIKLSRCNSDNGKIWKPVQIEDNIEQFNTPNDNQIISEQTSSPLPIHTKNVHPRSSIGEEGLNCVPKKRLALDDDVFCHSYVLNDYNTQASPSSSSSSSSSSSDESNSSKTKKLLNYTHSNDTNNQHLCLSEDSSMDSTSD
ncbi:bromodomain testis-specific protein-like [Panonychus citri]|uniref:bromodomain testis-specific protein-like n=1 Tax=Panonychus citri TaxID=50023 RepID=UPI0023072BCB|nr:bromodomain testis-specific protein-like [Panonychus citri]